MTPEERADRELHQRWLRERIAYDEGQVREEDERLGRPLPALQPPRPRASRVRQERLQAMVRERIAYHEARAREEDERRARESS